jgi:hypothetical protein
VREQCPRADTDEEKFPKTQRRCYRPAAAARQNKRRYQTRFLAERRTEISEKYIAHVSKKKPCNLKSKPAQGLLTLETKMSMITYIHRKAFSHRRERFYLKMKYKKMKQP